MGSPGEALVFGEKYGAEGSHSDVGGITSNIWGLLDPSALLLRLKSQDVEYRTTANYAQIQRPHFVTLLGCKAHEEWTEGIALGGRSSRRKRSVWN